MIYYGSQFYILFLEVLYQDQEEEGGKEFLGKEANISAKQLSFSYGNKVIIDHNGSQFYILFFDFIKKPLEL